MNFKIVNLSNISPLPDTCSILDPIPWFVEYANGSRFLTVELSWQTHLSLHQRVDYASRHDDEDSKSFDLLLATSPPVFYKCFFLTYYFLLFILIVFVSWQEFWQLSCCAVAKFSYSCLAIAFLIFVFSLKCLTSCELWHSKECLIIYRKSKKRFRGKRQNL